MLLSPFPASVPWNLNFPCICSLHQTQPPGASTGTRGNAKHLAYRMSHQPRTNGSLHFRPLGPPRTATQVGKTAQRAAFNIPALCSSALSSTTTTSITYCGIEARIDKLIKSTRLAAGFGRFLAVVKLHGLVIVQVRVSTPANRRIQINRQGWVFATPGIG